MLAGVRISNFLNLAIYILLLSKSFPEVEKTISHKEH
jgi:hypothetical protein